jgi:hypothetical protein
MGCQLTDNPRGLKNKVIAFNTEDVTSLNALPAKSIDCDLSSPQGLKYPNFSQISLLRQNDVSLIAGTIFIINNKNI